MITVLLGLTAAAFFGTSDFLGGLASRVTNSRKVTALSACTGLVVLSTVAILIGGRWSTEAVVLGALSGLSAAIAISLLYACLAIGPMSVLSPLAGLVSSSLPMVFGLLQGERLMTVGYVAIGLALMAVLLVGFAPEKGAVRPRPIGVMMALGAGTMFAVFLILMDMTPSDSGLIPLAASRAANALIMTTASLLMAYSRFKRAVGPESPLYSRETAPRPVRLLFEVRAASPWRRGVKVAIACGILDSLGNSLQLLGLRVGELSIMSVLNGLYPAVIIVLAALVMKERVTPVQLLGLLLAVAAAALFSIS